MKHEYEDKFNQFKKMTERKLNKIANEVNNREISKNRDQLEDLLNIDLEEFNKFEDINDSNYLPKMDTEENNKTIFMYIKDNSLLKQANYFLEKEKKTIEKELSKLNDKLLQYEENVTILKEKNKENEIEISRLQYGETLNQSRLENKIEDDRLNRAEDDRLNMSMPYGFNRIVKQKKEESFRMSRDDLKSLANLLADNANLIKDTKSK
eukprot:CAMPEP_0205817204 /NCGR_PEP_ID=MMETSP0205-20121125/23934_1 /ASSEMBLY_ACC=CAM_ASM_000278 /TAXON_ID=36767 /ORGANISM="Euplotes focardii, Strain TN1" /LENGTH=208 /DNA_ID=CAMNT_0053107201 /DNA_START=687 /DNA_END=1310 /DNA_ORIENTATION=-